MSIESDKLMNLADGQVLYNDLRQRTDARAVIDDSAGAGDTDKTFSADKLTEELGDLKKVINVLTPAATSSDVGKFLKAKTVADGKVTEYEFGSGGGGGTVTDVQVNGTSVVMDGVANIIMNPVQNISGTTPSINAESGYRYICGECSTLTIVAPASGCIDVTFQSGSTPTVLTVSSAKTGVTAIKWANGFDPTSLDADTTYEINILDGEYGVVGSWT